MPIYVPPNGGEVDFEFGGGGGYEPPPARHMDFDFRLRAPYIPPEGNMVGLAFGPAYQPPSGSKVGLEFVQDGEDTGGEIQYVFPVTFEAAGYGSPVAWNYDTRVAPASIESTLAFGSQTANNYRTYAKPRGWDSANYGRPAIKNRNVYLAVGGIYATGFGWPSLINWSKDVFPRGFLAQEFSRHPAKVWNLLQIRSIRGFSASFYGRPFVAGGVKYLYLKGKDESGYGRPVVINTTADQYANPKGIAPPLVGYASVSPRMVYPRGLLSGSYGNPLVQFPPHPKGWESSRAGTPEIDYWTKILSPAGMGVGEPFGYPVVRDRAQKILVPSLLGTGIFGDTRLHSTAGFIHAYGSDFFESSSFTEVRSNKRGISFSGFNAQLFGSQSVWNKTPSLQPVGIAPILISPASVGYWQRTVRTRGYQNDGYGKPVLKQTPSIAPKGFSGELGVPYIWPAIRSVFAKGKDSQEFGSHVVWFSLRSTLLDGFEVSLYGKPKIEYSRREILADGQLMDGYGRPKVSTLNRSIEPEGIFYEFPVVHTVGGLRFMKAFGFVATRFGSRIIPERQTAYPQGFTNTYGIASVENFTKVVRIAGFSTGVQEADRWGRAKLFNLRQYIAMYFDPDSELTPPVWPRWTLIENRTKNFRVSGHNSQLFGNAIIFNNARTVSLKGIAPPDLPGYYEAGMVAYRIRRLPIQGLEAPYLSGWSRVYNDAFVIRPRGFDDDAYGEAELKNTRRYFPWIGGLLSEKQGVPMIAYRVRSIEFEPRYSIAPPRIQLHVVDLYTRYIECAGEDYSKLGWASLQIVFRKITPRWTHKDYFGWADLWNVTPELRTRGRASDEFGDPLTRLEWRPVDPDGSNMQLFGLTSIADRDRDLSVGGLKAWAFGDKLRVIRLGQPPYTEQYIDLGVLNEETDKGFGIWPPGDGRANTQVPRPSLNQYVIYADGFVSDKHGSAHIQSNALIVDSGINDSANGEPVITMKLRSIHVPEGERPLEPSKARVSPHTIWAKPARAQAGRNHPESRDFRPVGETATYSAGERFGRSRVSTWRGDVYARAVSSSSRVGRPKLDLRLRYIRTESIVAYRNGWQSIDGGYRHVNQFDSSEFTVFGRPAIAPPPYTGPQYVKAGNISLTQFGRHVSEPLHRAFRMAGFNSLRMGLAANPGRPYMWQGLRIGPLMPTIPIGDDMHSWGESWVSHRVREVCVEGFDTFLSEYELENFRERLKVELAKKPRPPNQYLALVGVEVSAVSVPNVALRTHYILPDGNAEQYRKGAPS